MVRIIKITWLCQLVTMLCLALSACNRVPADLSDVVLSYQENPTGCAGCPKFKVDFSEGGEVTFTGQRVCAVPGVQRYHIPETEFRELVDAFYDNAFFSIPRLDVKRVVIDGTIVQLGYRDDRRVHETIDVDRRLPHLAQLEKRLREAARLDEFLKPSVSTYQELLKSGWDVNTLGEDHENALLSAVQSNDLDSVKLLLQHGATISERALNYSTFASDAAVTGILLNAAHTDMQSPLAGRLLMNAASRNADVTRLLLQKGADLNFRDPQSGKTALMTAVSDGSLDNAVLLVSKGAAVNATDNSLRTALMFAATQTNSGFTSLLAHHGAMVNAQDSDGRTALMWAAEMCFYWNIEPLVAAGADPNITNKNGRTAVQLLMPPSYQKCQTSRQLMQVALRK